MRTRYFDHLALDHDEVVYLVMEAALCILRRHGQMTADDQGPMRIAHVDGYTIRYYRLYSSDNLTLELPSYGEGGTSIAPLVPHCIDVEASELLFGLRWDCTGLRIRRVLRGPWEYGILQAAGMGQYLSSDRPLPPCAAESKSRNEWPLVALRQVRRRRLGAPLRFSVAGYSRCIHRLLTPGATFEDIVAIVGQGYRESRLRDGREVQVGSAPSCFGLWAWGGDRSLRFGKRMTKPDLSYWVSPTGGYEAAASLLLLLDREQSSKRQSSVDRAIGSL